MEIKKIKPEITEKTRPYLGILFSSVSEGKGVVVTFVSEDSPAEKAELKADDLITAVNGKSFYSRNGFLFRINCLKQGEKAELDVVRKDKKMKITVTVGKKLLNK